MNTEMDAAQRDSRFRQIHVFNKRDPLTRASVHPQYNMLNVVYRLYVQIFQRIENAQFPPYIEEYMESQGVTFDRVFEQKKLIADLIDGMLQKEYSRDTGENYLRKCMEDCRWKERFDWQAMAVFDMLASPSLLAYFFDAMADLVSEEDIKAQNIGELREIIDRQCRRAVDHNSTSRGLMNDDVGVNGDGETPPTSENGSVPQDNRTPESQQ